MRTQLKSIKHCRFLWWRKWNYEDTLLCLLAASTAPWDGLLTARHRHPAARATGVAFCCFCCCSKRNHTVSSLSGHKRQKSLPLWSARVLWSPAPCWLSRSPMPCWLSVTKQGLTCYTRCRYYQHLCDNLPYVLPLEGDVLSSEGYWGLLLLQASSFFRILTSCSHKHGTPVQRAVEKLR